MRNAKENIDRILKKYSTTIEITTGILAIAFLIYKMRSTLISGNTTFFHDNIMWNYPIFQFFAENLINNHFPYWNPFTHSGEPLYPVLAQLRFFEPITLLTIYLGQFITNDVAILFNWNFVNKSLMMAFGVYIVFRPLATHLFIRLSLIPILLYSSFMVVSFRQCGIFDQFVMIPFVAFFLLRIVYYKDYRWHNWFALAGTIGINWQSYFFTGTWIFLLFFLLGLVIFRRDLLADLFKSKMVFAKFAVMFAIVFAMAAPSVVLLKEKDRYAFPARMLDTSYEGKLPQGGPQQYEGEPSGLTSSSSGINMSYRFIAFTGTFSTIWDFIQFIAPDGNKHILWPGRDSWGKPSEAYIYLGFLPWAIAILGMVAGKHDLKRVWLLVLIGFGLLMLGPAGGLHRLMYHIYPPMWFVRHTHSFVLIFIFAFLYFFILGFNHIFSTWGGSIFRPDVPQGILNRLVKNDNHRNCAAMILFSACIIFSLCLMAQLEYPVTNYLFILFVPIIAVGWLLRKDLGEKGFYICLIASHLIIVFIFTDNHWPFFRYTLEMFLAPLALFMFFKTRRNLSESARYYLVFFLFVSFAFCLVADLTYHFNKSSLLYLGTPRPGLIHNVKTTHQKPLLPQERSVYPKYSNNIYNNQDARYLSLIYRQPFVFSPVMTVNQDFRPPFGLIGDNDILDETIFDVFKKFSFEKWFISPDGSLSPEWFDCQQDFSDGSVERYVYDDGVKVRKILALLKPSSRGNTTLIYKTDKIEDLRGHYIRVSVMAKSENKTLDAIQIGLQDGTETIILKSYENSGTWERLELISHIGENAENITLTCNVKSTATAGVYFDRTKIEVLPYNEFFDYNNIIQSKTVFDDFKNSLFYNYTISKEAVCDEFIKFSFEKWFILPDDSWCPEQFVYQQGRSGGSVERYIYEDGDKEKQVCALLKPSSRGNSSIAYQTDQIDDLRGRYIRVSAMVKSENKTPKAVQIDVQSTEVRKLQDGVLVSPPAGAPVIQSYGNSGTWERLVLIMYIGKDAETIKLTCNVRSIATAGACFDLIKIDVMAQMEAAPHNMNNSAFELEGVLKSKRWSSFLLPKKYFELIHTDIPYPALVEMFAVDKPVFQFKKEFVQVEESEIPAFLRRLGPVKSVNLLQDAAIIVDKKLDASLSKLKRKTGEYVNRNQEVPFANGESGFTYTVEDYTYDSCDLKVSTDNEGLLYWADGYDKGWHAYVNKKEVPLYRANVNFKAIAIPKGTSYINFTYDPFFFKAGLFVFNGMFIMCLAVLIITGFYNISRGKALR